MSCSTPFQYSNRSFTNTDCTPECFVVVSIDTEDDFAYHGDNVDVLSKPGLMIMLLLLSTVGGGDEDEGGCVGGGDDGGGSFDGHPETHPVPQCESVVPQNPHWEQHAGGLVQGVCALHVFNRLFEMAVELLEETPRNVPAFAS